MGWRELSAGSSPRKLDVLKPNIYPRIEASEAIMLVLKCHYDESRIFSIKPILKHKQEVCMRRKMLLIIFLGTQTS